MPFAAICAQLDVTRDKSTVTSDPGMSAWRRDREAMVIIELQAAPPQC